MSGLPAAIAAGAAIAFCACLLCIVSLARASGGKARIRRDACVAATVAGAFLGPACMMAGGIGLPVAIALSAFCAVAFGAALIDRSSAWAPDGVVMALCVTAGVLGAAPAGDGMAQGALDGASVFAIVNLFWVAVARLRPAAAAAVPPPDVIALLLPILVFGVTLTTFSSYTVMILVIFACRQSPMVLSLVTPDDVASDAARAEGFGAGGARLTFLAVGLPVTALVAAANAAFLPCSEWISACFT